MGRKIKSVLLLIMVLVIIYCQHSEVTYAEELSDKNVETESGEEEPEPVREYTLEYSEPDGMNGYYVRMPEIRISHEDTRGATVYSLQNNGNIKAEGELTADHSTVTLYGEQFGEGLNILNIYMKDEEGAEIEGYSRKQGFWVDTKAPVFDMEAAEGFDVWYSKEARIYVSATDMERGSMVESISCYCGNEMIGSVKNSKAEFLIQYASKNGTGIPVTVTVTDKAGNRSEKTRHIYIDNSAPQVMINGIRDYMITSQPSQVTFRVLEDNVFKECIATVEWEGVSGNKEKILPEEWTKKPGISETSITLSEDGIYHLRIFALDKAGHSDEKEMQIIIDSQSPVIRHVDDLNGKYMKKFQWNYPEDVFIWDFTTYSCQIQLDGMLYFSGQEITAEGQHVMRIQVTDAAGNRAEARAEFVIDHTPPEIIFQDINEAELYEDEKTFQVALKNSEDEIQEVRINGVQQTLGNRRKACQFTVREIKDYEVIVKACDKAGNQKTSGIMFEIIPEETVLQKMINPVKKIFVGGNTSVKKEEQQEKNGKKKECFSCIWLAMTGLVGVLTGIGVWYKRKR